MYHTELQFFAVVSNIKEYSGILNDINYKTFASDNNGCNISLNQVG
jgi:hypothetical protein